MEQFSSHREIYFKCTACSECFLEEEVFFAHSRTWHCKILVSEGNSPSETTPEPNLGNECDHTANVMKTEAIELPVYDENNATNEQLANSQEYIDKQLLETQDSDKDGKCIGVDKHLACSETETKHLTYFVPDASHPSTSISGVSNKLSRDRRQQQRKRSIQKEAPLRRPVQKNAPVRPSPQNSSMNVDTLMSVTNQKQYQCNFCFYHTTRKTGLVRHLRQHTGEKPFKCSYCNKCFSRNFTLTKHLKVHAT